MADTVTASTDTDDGVTDESDRSGWLLPAGVTAVGWGIAANADGVIGVSGVLVFALGLFWTVAKVRGGS